MNDPPAEPRRSKRKQKVKVRLDVDLNAVLTGFGSARVATSAHHRLVEHYASPLLIGPPPSEDLLELVVHMYTESEADVAQHLPPLRPRTPAKVAKRSGRTVGDVDRVLGRLARHKQIVLGMPKPQRYTILPLVPGTFEMTMMRTDLRALNAWHQKFAELFQRLWDTGYVRDYVAIRPPPIRYLPVTAVADTLQMAWPSDRLEQILERYDRFAIANCQCRTLTRLVGHGCDKPLDNCAWFGPLAEFVLKRGLAREVTRQQVLDAKRQAEEHHCVTWMINEYGDPRGNVSCSCCGCCCHGLQTINQFSAPGAISKPHFMPQRDRDTCKLCGKCMGACPMGAWRKIGAQLYFDAARCIGCGLCKVACRAGALTLEPVAAAQPPEPNWDSLLRKAAPSLFRNAVRIWARRVLMRRG